MIRNQKLIRFCFVVVAVFLIVSIANKYPLVLKKAQDFLCQEWTGFCESTTGKQSVKRLWDWLELVAVPIVIAILGQQFQNRDREKVEQKAELEREIAKDNLSEGAIQVYLDRIAGLLLDKELRKELFSDNDFPNQDNPVQDLARILTITILRRLEGDLERQVRIIHFLRDTDLLGFIFKNANLSRINLEGAHLVEANLGGTNLGGANLEGAHLWEANLEGAHLRGARLKGAYLGGANLGGANLEGAHLRGVYLEGAHLEEANLEEAHLRGAHLEEAHLERDNLEEAHLEKANLEGAHLGGANLRGANLEEADLERAHLGGANLRGANLEGANLRGAHLEGALLWEANLRGAHLEKAKLEKAKLEKAKSFGSHLTAAKIKSTCNWDKAIYKQDKKENRQYIEQLKKDRASDPKEPPDCSRWDT